MTLIHQADDSKLFVSVIKDPTNPSCGMITFYRQLKFDQPVERVFELYLDNHGVKRIVQQLINNYSLFDR